MCVCVQCSVCVCARMSVAVPTLMSVLHDHIAYLVVELNHKPTEPLLVWLGMPGTFWVVHPIDPGVARRRNQKPSGVCLYALLRWL